MLRNVAEEEVEEEDAAEEQREFPTQCVHTRGSCDRSSSSSSVPSSSSSSTSSFSASSSSSPLTSSSSTWSSSTSSGIVRGQMDIINVCHVKNPCVPMRCALKIIPNNKSCSNSFQWLCHFFRMAHRDETTKCYLRQERAFTQHCVLQSLYKHVPVLPFTTKLAQTRGFAASPIDTAT